MALSRVELLPLLRRGPILGVIIYPQRKDTTHGREGVPLKLNADANALFRSVSSDFHKTNNLKYNSAMEVHGQSLLQEGQAADIHNLVKLQRLIEQIVELHVRSSPNLLRYLQSHNRSMIPQWIDIFHVWRLWELVIPSFYTENPALTIYLTCSSQTNLLLILKQSRSTPKWTSRYFWTSFRSGVGRHPIQSEIQVCYLRLFEILYADSRIQSLLGSQNDVYQSTSTVTNLGSSVVHTGSNFRAPDPQMPLIFLAVLRLARSSLSTCSHSQNLVISTSLWSNGEG